MPIYEFLCPACNRVYSFLSQSYNPEKTPTCPKCGATDLTKEISRFSFVRSAASAKFDTAPGAGFDDGPSGGMGGPGGMGGMGGMGGPGEPDPFDDPRVEREMMKLMSEAEHMDENDPRQLGRLMRKMSEITGEPLEGEMEEAVRRLELGEDPEKIEEDMGDVLGDEMGGMDGMGMGGPSYDDGLYPM